MDHIDLTNELTFSVWIKLKDSDESNSMGIGQTFTIPLGRSNQQ
ncbi:hypothetical protein [Mycoplasmoides gallisepticum]|nr:hypothetical protein [Mycoplasmoides gallisepticum]